MSLPFVSNDINQSLQPILKEFLQVPLPYLSMFSFYLPVTGIVVKYSWERKKERKKKKGGAASESLGKTIAPPENSPWLFLPVKYSISASGYKIFLLPVLFFAPSSPRHYFFTALSFFFTSRRQTNERTSKRTNER
jgi:hypothetical protein